MPHYDIRHKTTYRYAYPVTVSHHSARLKPLSDETQTCESYSLSISPSSVDMIERIDYFGNSVQMFSVQEAHDALVAESRSNVHVKREALDLTQFDTPCGAVRKALFESEDPDLLGTRQLIYSIDSVPDTPEVDAFAKRFITPDQPFGQAIIDLLDAFVSEFTFDPKATELSTPIDLVLQERKGVCQDFAHLMIAGLRLRGLAAR